MLYFFNIINFIQYIKKKLVLWNQIYLNTLAKIKNSIRLFLQLQYNSFTEHNFLWCKFNKYCNTWNTWLSSLTATSLAN